MEGEVVAVVSAGVPILFQHLMRRFKRVHGIKRPRQEHSVAAYLFDVLYLNGGCRRFMSGSYQKRQI